MIIAIRDSPLGLFYYREKPVMGSLGRPGQNHLFIVAIERQDWLSPSPESYEN
jgi:hypothetical protein